MIDDLIIIIPTHNRQHYLGRVIRYYSSFPCKVYICDSSKQKAEVETPENINYRWVPQSNFYGKVLDVLNETSSDFYALSPDDDFLKQETLMECYEALKGNEYYSFGIGRQVFFKEGFKEGFYTTVYANQLQGINDLIFSTRDDYIKYFWGHYQNILWSLFRKDVVMGAFNCLKQCDFKNGNFVELTLGIEGVRRGSVYVSPNGMNYREMIETDHWGDLTPPITKENIKKDISLKNDLDIFKLYYHNDGGIAALSMMAYLNADDDNTIKGRIKTIIPKQLKLIIKRLIYSQSKTNISLQKNIVEDKEMSELIKMVLS